MNWHVAQINIGRLIAPISDPLIAGFVSQLEPINALADRAPGFVWRLQSDSGNATDIVYSDDPTMMVNMSVWESVETLRDYVYSSAHVQVFRERARWFEKLPLPPYCLWWVPACHQPSVAEGRDRLEHYQQNGATPYSFWFSQRYPPPRADAVHA